MRGYIPTLDGWRAIAILAVIIHHATVSHVYPGGAYASGRGLWLSRLLGDYGVAIFFALSGFLICTRLLQEHRKTDRISLKSFYLRRAFRILPPYFLYLAILGVIAAAGVIQVEPIEWISCAFFFRNYVPGPTPPFTGWYTGHFWSLSIEEHFYLFWPLMLVVCGNKRARSAVVVLAFLVMVWRALDTRFAWIEVGYVGHRTDTRLDGLLWGCWVALLLDVPAYKDWITKWFSPWVWLGAIAALLGVVWVSPLAAEMVSPFLLPWLLVGTVLRPGQPFSRALELEPVRWIGRISYSLYLWQQLFVMGSMKVSRPFAMGWLQELPLNILAAFACAAASYYVVERPLITLGQRANAAVTRTPA
jgi:peptidoglycan/LPS O-acetylase OafA/YrhL